MPQFSEACMNHRLLLHIIDHVFIGYFPVPATLSKLINDGKFALSFRIWHEPKLKYFAGVLYYVCVLGKEPHNYGRLQKF